MSAKRLRSVIQSTAHHAVSGLCYVHPYLGSVCKKLGIESIRINLLEPNFDPELGDIPKELSLSIYALREKFYEILASEHMSQSEVQEVFVTFDFLQSKWPIECFISALDSQGKRIEAVVGFDGNSVRKKEYKKRGNHNFKQ